MEDSLEGIKVMVIDDSKTIRRTAETLLSKAGCEVITATDGFDALAKIADDQQLIAMNHVRRIIHDEFPPKQHDKMRARYLPDDIKDKRPFSF